MLLVLAGGPLLGLLPGDPGSVRVGGVGLRWWYGAALGPGLALLLAVAAVRGVVRLGLITFSASPALLAALAASVFAGGVGAPLLALAVVAAPLAGVLARPVGPWGGPERASFPRTGAVAVGALSVGLVLGANLLVLGDLARLLGGERWHGLAGGLALALAVTAWPGGAWSRVAAPALGVAGLALPIAIVGTTTETWPWMAWSRLASRPALVFGEESAWVSDGGVLLAPARLVFSEPHRVTALAEGAYRVVERDHEREAVREWRLRPGDTLVLRPGDRLDLDVGARVRFETGGRVPGAAMSGAAWADRRAEEPLPALVGFLGLVITLAGGAVALGTIRPAPGRLGWLGAPMLLFVLPMTVLSLSVYAAAASPDLALAAPPVAPLVRLPRVAVAAPWDGALAIGVVAAFAALFVAAAAALRDGLLREVLAAPRARGGAGALADAIWVVLAGAATVFAASWPGEAWRAFTLGCGLATSALAAPSLARAGGPARLVGALIGAAVFGAVALGGAGLRGWPPVITEYPALAAAPLAWVATRLYGLARTEGQ